MLCVSKMWVCRSELYGSFGTCRQPQPSSRLAHHIPLFYVCFVCLGRPWDPTAAAWRTPTPAYRTPPPADLTLARRTLAPACLGSCREPGHSADAQWFPVGLVLCYVVLRHSRWPAGRMRRRHHRRRNPPPWRHRRHAGNSSLSKRDLNGEHRVGIAQKPFQKRYLGLYIFCRLRPFASISLVRIGTSLVG